MRTLQTVSLVVGLWASTTSPAFSAATASTTSALGYSINGGSGWDLRVANEDGTNAFTVYSNSSSVAFDVGLKGANTAAVIDLRVAKLITWELGLSGGVTTHQKSLPTSGQAQSLSFSQDGSKLAVFTSPDNLMHIFDVATGAELANWPSLFAYKIAWYRDGSRIAINADASALGGAYRLMSYNADGTNPQTLASFASLDSMDTSRSTTDDSVLVSYGTSADIRINKSLNGINGPILVLGSAPSWRCDGGRFVFKQYSTTKSGAWFFYEPGTGLTSTFSNRKVK